ncbi:MAG: hypothetical protein GEU94_09945 [Micromonosporaceae bacterium]|nr:hypothetical protein [Micromonosporaceae bacterium]
MTTFIAMALIGGLLFGWLTGRRVQKASRAWTEYRATKHSLATLRTVAWALTRPAAAFVVLAIIIAVYALYLTASQPS